MSGPHPARCNSSVVKYLHESTWVIIMGNGMPIEIYGKVQYAGLQSTRLYTLDTDQGGNSVIMFKLHY